MSTEQDAKEANITVAVTGAGGTGGMAAIQTLNQTTEFEIIGVDMNPKAVGLYIADEGLVVPPATADNWIESVQDILTEYDVDAVLPLIDEEVEQIGDLRNRCSDTVFVAPEASFVDLCLDKYRLMSALDKAGINIPETWSVEEAVELNKSVYPLILKPRTERGGRGIYMLESPDSLQDALAETTREYSDLLVQKALNGTEYTTSVVCTTENSVLSVVPKEAVRKDRSTVHGVTRNESKVINSCQSVIDYFEPSGPINIQQICDADGVPHVIEINPRFSSSACLTVAAGVNETKILIQDALRLSYEPPDEFETDLHMLRYTDQVFIKDENISSGGALDTDEI